MSNGLKIQDKEQHELLIGIGWGEIMRYRQLEREYD